MKGLKWENIEFKKGANKNESDKIVITKQEEIDIKSSDVKDLVELEKYLVKKLREQVNQIKVLKSQAQQTRELILKIRRKGVGQLNAIRDE